jgi:Holliday junction resolvasome RuvABC endonuclease subunit
MRDQPLIIAFDPSTVGVGVAVGPAREQGPDKAYTYMPPRDAQVDARIRAITVKAFEIIEEHLPDVVVIEEPAGDHHNRATDRKLARAGQSIESAATLVSWETGHPIRVIRIYPSQVKATGASKDNTRYAASLIQGSDEYDVSGDSADAIGAWLAADTQLKQERLERWARDDR